MDFNQIINKSAELQATTKVHIHDWFTKEKYKHYKSGLDELIVNEDWQELNDSFFRVLPFGTGGRRGKVGIGSNRVNRVTVGETVQALCDYLKQLYASSDIKGVAIAHDSRLSSRELAEYSGKVVEGNGIKAYLFEGPRSTPELSFTVRNRGLTAGIVITASHNPSTDNGIKLYWADGGQLVPPHDTNILALAENGSTIQEGELDNVVKLGKGDDEAYWHAVLKESRSGDRKLKIAYSPLHGTGITSVKPVLEKAGYDVVIYEPQATMDGNFPNVTNQIPNPELPEANDQLSSFTLEVQADIAISNDPDADRYCAVVRVGDETKQLNGNQSAVLMTDYILSKMKQARQITNKHFISSTIVTTDMLLAIADNYGVRAVSNLLVGFKYIGEQIHLRCDIGDEIFVCGGEESYGGIVGTYTRDKDGAAPALMLAELASELKYEGRNLIDKLDQLYNMHGYFHEELHSFGFAGAAGFETMKAFMHDLRNNSPSSIAGITVKKVRDYIKGEEIFERFEDVLRFEFSDDGKNRITIRPSGTEPKLKLYIQLFSEVSNNLEEVKIEIANQAKTLKEELSKKINNFGG